MSWFGFTNFTKKKITQLNVVLHYEDSSYYITPGIAIPECRQESVDIEYDSNDVVTKVTQYNDYGAEQVFTSGEDLLEYIQDNWEDISDNEFEELEPIIQELDFSKIYKTRKVAA